MNFLRRRKNADSDSDDADNEAKSNIHKSRKPPNTAFRQQRLKAWQPLMTPKSVIPFLFVLAIIFAPLGIAILHTTYNVEFLSVDYSDCASAASSYDKVPNKDVGYHFRKANTNPEFKWRTEKHTDAFGDDISTCYLQFTLPRDLKGPIYMYYQLTNFYQNHRKYVESYDLEQLKGIAVTPGDITSDCRPLDFVGSGDDRKIVYPCGLIANSYFNDTISDLVLLNTQNNRDNETYAFTQDGISWSSDRNHKYKKTNYQPDQIVPPPNWHKMFPQGYNETNIPDLQTWELLQNWMRTAGLPTFYKLYGKNNTATLTAGTYEFTIDMTYPVSGYGGRKSVIITTNSIFGGRNMALGIIYIIVAVISLVLAIAFLLQTLIKPRKIGDHDFLQNDRPLVNYREQL